MAAQARLSAIEMIEAHRLFDKPPLYMIGSFDSRVTVLAQQTRALSRWVPWELGLADGYKGMDSIAIFPAAENSYEQSWASWEYLGYIGRSFGATIATMTSEYGWC